MRRLAAIASVLAAFACTVPALAMRVDVPFQPGRTCLDSRSPVLLLRDVPKGTATLRIRIGTPGDWTGIPSSKVIPYTGDRIEKGAVRHFMSCRHGWKNWASGRSVEIRVDARDAQGRRLATARDRAWYPGF
jgi:hypothetical protein